MLLTRRGPLSKYCEVKTFRNFVNSFSQHATPRAAVLPAGDLHQWIMMTSCCVKSYFTYNTRIQHSQLSTAIIISLLKCFWLSKCLVSRYLDCTWVWALSRVRAVCSTSALTITSPPSNDSNKGFARESLLQSSTELHNIEYCQSKSKW